MSGALKIVWSARAHAEWRQLSFAEAEAVATAVERFARGEPIGIVRAIGPFEFVLHVDVYAVTLIHDTATDTLHVDSVQRA